MRQDGGAAPEEQLRGPPARPRLELERPRLLYLRQRAYAGEYIRRQFTVDLDQCDRVAAGRVASNVEGRDVDAGVAHG